MSRRAHRHRKARFKFKIRISKFETNSKSKIQKNLFGNIRIFNLRACLGFRASNFEFLSHLSVLENLRGELLGRFLLDDDPVRVPPFTERNHHVVLEGSHDLFPDVIGLDG
jgi:hypothetical protein